MNVANLAELKLLMSRSGMEMDESGVASVKPTEKMPEVEKAPPELMAALKDLTDLTRAGIASSAAAMVTMAAKPEVEIKPVIKKWVFTVERVHGEMSRIVAEAVSNDRSA